MSNKVSLFIVLVLSACLAAFASDIYAPSVLSISKEFVSSLDAVQWSMAIYMLSLAISQLFYGPISEVVGRKKPMMLGITIMLIGNIICIFSSSVEMLILGRFIQGFGAGGPASLFRSVFRDVYSSEDLSKYGSYLAIVVTSIVPIAPALGGFLETSIGWRYIFVFMCGYTIFALFLMKFFLKETSTAHTKENAQISYVISNFKALLTSRLFMGCTMCNFLAYGGLFANVIVLPILLMDHLNVPAAQFGVYIFFTNASSYALSALLNGLFVKRFGMKFMMNLGFSIMTLSGIFMLTGYFLFGISLWAILTSQMLYSFGSTFIWPNSYATSFTPFGHIAGYTGALYGFMQTCGAGVLGGLMAFLPENNQLPLAITLVSCSLLAFGFYRWGTQPQKARSIQ